MSGNCPKPLILSGAEGALCPERSRRTRKLSETAHPERSEGALCPERSRRTRALPPAPGRSFDYGRTKNRPASAQDERKLFETARPERSGGRSLPGAKSKDPRIAAGAWAVLRLRPDKEPSGLRSG